MDGVKISEYIKNISVSTNRKILKFLEFFLYIKFGIFISILWYCYYDIDNLANILKKLIIKK